MPEYERHGDSFFITWPDKGIGFGINRIRDNPSWGLQGYLTVDAITPEQRGNPFGPVMIGLENGRQQGDMADTLALRVNGFDKQGWLRLVADACSKVSREWRKGSDTLDLAGVPDTGPIPYLWDLLVPMLETTILYGDGLSAKSMIALMLAVSHSLGLDTPWGPPPPIGRVLYLDWETNSGTMASRLRRICAGIGCSVPSIDYRMCIRSINDELPSIIEDISRKQYSLVIVDSIGFAVTGSLNDDDTARGAIGALRQMPCTRLVVGHVSADTAKNPNNKASPFGSRFFWNGMRSGVEVRRSQDGVNDDDDVIDVGMYHRKGNDGKFHRPIAMRVSFDGRTGPICFDKQDIVDVPDLAVGQTLPARLRLLLKRGSATAEQLGDQMDVKPDKVRTALNRMPDVMRVIEGGGRGNPTTYGLKDAR